MLVGVEVGVAVRASVGVADGVAVVRLDATTGTSSFRSSVPGVRVGRGVEVLAGVAVRVGIDVAVGVAVAVVNSQLEIPIFAQIEFPRSNVLVLVETSFGVS